MLTPCSWVLLEKLTVTQLVKNFPAFYETRSFITSLRIVHHLSLSRSSSFLSLYQSVSPGLRLSMWTFHNKIHFYSWWVVSTSPNPQAGWPPHVDCPRLLFQYIRNYPPYWRPFLYPQPEDAPCHGDRDPLTYLLIPCSKVLLEKLTGSQLVKKFPAFYGTRRFHYRVRKCPPLVPIMSQLDPVLALYIPKTKNPPPPKKNTDFSEDCVLSPGN